jgi:hypothetical protein
MRASLINEILRALTDSRTLKVVGVVLFLNLIVFTAGWFYVDQFTSRKPCVVCGRPNTKPVKTLWQYEVKVIPYCKDVVLWYCPLHINDAPPLVTQIPSSKDTIFKRYILAIIGGLIQLITLFYALVLMRFEIKYLAFSPLVIGIAFLVGGTTSSLSLTIIFASVAIFPLTFLYLWLKKKDH